MEIIKRLGGKLICRLPSVHLISDAFVSQLSWTEEVDKYIAVFDEPINGEWDVLGRITGIDRVWVIYSAMKAEIEATGAGQLLRFIETDLPDAQELAGLFSKTRMDYYHSINRALTERQVSESAAFIEKVLPGTRRICLQKDGESIALLMLVEAKDYEGQPVDWIPWVWIDKTLTSSDRETVHRRFRQWLKAGPLVRVQCSVASGNGRSQKFFRKLGFKPECLHILKEKH